MMNAYNSMKEKMLLKVNLLRVNRLVRLESQMAASGKFYPVLR